MRRLEATYQPLGVAEGGLCADERLGTGRELTERQNQRLERMLKCAHLRLAATIEDVDFRRPRGLERAQT